MFERQVIAPDVELRILLVEDAIKLTEAYQRNREHLAPWEPTRPAEFFTERFQREDIERRLIATRSDEGFPLVLVSGNEIIGRFNLAGITRGPFQSAGLGYWVDRNHLGRGLAGATVRAIVEEARDKLGLHRIEASTLVHNAASQRVLLKNGFHQIGMAPQYLQIAGEWQDHNLYQRILHE
ncbi:GNAT family N-acetyltransferase [Microbacterium sp. SORGH_AS_0888]|uniref:GNAT family N-acetyltransferase n=1 Tax=Microbacterium sp. SORGH_AS_0888 TaxID=3041791 RepID=UPI0027899316|nr:GNAT family protein [Microbacterium sp. SORGH_AS_0888]MDQ1128386.1 ribosomal-protein-alanine N-acetyltransferase [Microbacterium sp. SORGH_AS_0888]